MNWDTEVREGQIDTTHSGRTFTRKELTNEAYHANETHRSRSTVHSVFRHGAFAHRYMKRGGRLFAGNAGTSLGSKFDRLWEAAHDGQKIEDVFCWAPVSVLSNGARRGKPYTDWLAEQQASGKEDISLDDLHKLQQMLANALECRRAKELLEATEDVQLSHFWEDNHGHKRKARFDGHTEREVYDVKTTSSAWKDLFRSFLDYGYIWQSAWYSDAAYEIGWPQFRMPFICVSSVAPYECRVVTIPEELVEQARQQIRDTLDLISLRESTGRYLPDDHGEEQELVFPDWVYSKEVVA